MKRSHKDTIKSIIQLFSGNAKDNVETYLIDVFDKAELYNVTVTLSPDRFVTDDGVPCNGWFSEPEGKEPGELIVATGQDFKKWFPIFIHESCHMDQWIEQIPIWDVDYKDFDSLDMLTLWHDGKIELTKDQFEFWCKPVRELELDCERRAVKTIKKYKLPLDPDYYAKRANSYVYFYSFMWKTRQWYTPGFEPYNIPEIVKLMPTHFDNNYSEVPDEIQTIWIRKLMEHKNDRSDLR